LRKLGNDCGTSPRKTARGSREPFYFIILYQ
jgi:hypothetical protein